MDSKIYQGLFVMLFALQHQFRSFMERRPELMEEMILYDDQWTGLTDRSALDLDYLNLEMIPYDDQRTGLTDQPELDLDYLNLDMNMHYDPQTGQTNQQAVDLDSDDLDELTGIEERSVELEVNILSAMIEILSSQSGISRWWRDVRNLQRRLTNLQEELRDAIETLGGRSTGKYRKRIFFDRWSMLQHKNQVRERCPLRFKSCPNIPSVLEDEELVLLRKSVSLNRTIGFKNSLEDILEAIDDNLDLLDELRQNAMMKLNFQQAAGQGNKSDSSGVKETASNATSHSSDQSGQHHVNATDMGHTEQHRNTEDDSRIEHHRSHRNNPDVAPSQGVPRAHNVTSTTITTTTTTTPTPNSRDRIQSRSSQRRLRTHNVTTTDATPNSREGIQSRSSQGVLRAHNVTTTTPNSRERIQSRSSQNTEDDSQIEHHRSHRNNPDVSPSQAHNITSIIIPLSYRERIQSVLSQNVSEISRSGASAQPDNKSQSPGVRKTVHKKGLPRAQNVTTTTTDAIPNSREGIQSVLSQNTEDDSRIEHHRSHRNNPDVSTSQGFLRAHNVTSTTTTANSRERIQSVLSQGVLRAHNITTTTTDATPNSREGIQSRSSQRRLRTHNVPFINVAATAPNSREGIQSRSSQGVLRAHNITSTTTTTTITTTTANSSEGIQSVLSQNVSEISRSGASAQPDNKSQSPGARKTMHEEKINNRRNNKS